MTPSNNCLTIIKSSEGCAVKQPNGMFLAYVDPGSHGPPITIGWGSTGKDIVLGLLWTQAQCDARLAVQAARAAGQVSVAVGNAHTTQNQFDALVSFQYNTGALLTSTLLKLHKEGNFKGVKAEFAKWTHSKGRVMNGLITRRAKEAALYGKADS